MSAPLTSSGSRGLEPGRDLLELALEVAGTSVTEAGAEDAPRRLCARLVRLGGLTGCAVVLLDDTGEGVRTLVGSHPEAEQLTRLVQQLGLGLGAEALRAGRATAVEDLTRSARPGLAEAAARVGLPVTAAVALRGPERLIGCLQLYGRTVETFTGGLLDQLAPLAEVLGAVLGNVDAYRYSTSLVARLTVALDRQAPIEQAKGLLAERHRTDLDSAYRMLRDQATRQGLTVGEVAQDLMRRHWHGAAPAEPADDGEDPDTEPSAGPNEQAPLPEQRDSSPATPHRHRAP